ncbi:MAG TPA: tRNA 2-thiouridine(34) synthase MnmA [Candidatus Paceibacterota bacterium]
MAHKVFVGLSGGVDSAVSAAILKERGFDVTGVFIKIWQPEFIECTWKEDRLDAMRVCAALGIAFRELDLSAQYKKNVIDAMLRDYARGVTPNPDILCNREIKFGAFARWARVEGAQLIATGHYARMREVAGHLELLRGSDPEKDQSYFLYRLTQQDLARAIFPVGGMLKSDVRKKARALKLPVAEKHDSQGLCFVGDVSMPDFLRRFVDVEQGTVLDTEGRTIGTHEGAPLYTIGARHGFAITDSAAAKTPHYVGTVDATHNTITVSPRIEDAARHTALISDIHWIHREPSFDGEFAVQTRYRQKNVPARLTRSAQGITATFSNAHVAPPGQSLVIYSGYVCLGGGIIQKESATKAQVSLHAGAKKVLRRVQ